MDERVRASTWGSANSDKPQELLRFNGAQKLPFVRMRLESIQPSKPFQAE